MRDTVITLIHAHSLYSETGPNNYLRGHAWKRLEATKRDARPSTAKKVMIGSGTIAPLDIRTSINAATIKKKPKAHENKSFCAVDLGLFWHIKMVTPMNTHPAPMFFLSASVAFSAASLAAMSGNIASVKKTLDQPRKLSQGVSLGYRLSPI